MQFFLYEIVARIVAIYLCVDCSRTLWRGLVERKIRSFNPEFLDWLYQPSERLTGARPISLRDRRDAT
jgi:hypothetical protein